ncbi:hypothetical protein AB6E53_06690 [Vibrio breoganii]
MNKIKTLNTINFSPMYNEEFQSMLPEHLYTDDVAIVHEIYDVGCMIIDEQYKYKCIGIRLTDNGTTKKSVLEQSHKELTAIFG